MKKIQKNLLGYWADKYAFVDYDPKLNYETGGVFYSGFSRVIALILMIFPKKLIHKSIEASPRAHKVRETATSHEALEIMYEGPKNEHNFKSSLGGHFWFRLRNARAVRNRLKLVKKIIGTELDSIDKNEIVIGSLGAGSARAVLEEVKKREGRTKFRIFLVDLNQRALDYSRLLAEELGITSPIIYVQEKVNCELEILQEEKFDIIEMVGLLDYFSDEKANKIIGCLKKSLVNRGLLITCNILDNAERKFVTEVIEWEMYYRTSDDLRRLLLENYFTESLIILEPLLIHGVAVGRNV